MVKISTIFTAVQYIFSILYFTAIISTILVIINVFLVYYRNNLIPDFNTIYAFYKMVFLFSIYLSLIPAVLEINKNPDVIKSQEIHFQKYYNKIAKYDVFKRSYLSKGITYISSIAFLSPVLLLGFFNYKSIDELFNAFVPIMIIITPLMLIQNYLLDDHDTVLINLSNYNKTKDIIYMQKLFRNINSIFDNTFKDESINELSKNIHGNIVINNSNITKIFKDVEIALVKKDETKLGNIMNDCIVNLLKTDFESVLRTKIPIQNRLINWIRSNWSKIIPQTFVTALLIWILSLIGVSLPK